MATMDPKMQIHICRKIHYSDTVDNNFESCKLNEIALGL